MIIIWTWLLKNTKISGITLYPFILLRSPELRRNSILLNHEKIHLRQQLELLIVFFYIWYILEYLYWYLRLGNSHRAYQSISFEREAYSYEHDFTYLRRRKLWGFWKFVGRAAGG